MAPQDGPDQALAFLARLAREFTAVLSLPDLVKRVLDSLRDEVGFDSCAVGLPDTRDPAVITLVGATGIRAGFQGLRIPRGHGVHWLVMETGEPLRIPDTHADPRVFRRDDRIRSAIYAPLTVRGRAIGVLSAYRKEVDAFTQGDLDLLTIVARYLAGAFEVARLYTSTQQALAERKQAEQLERDRNRVLELVARGEALPEILTQIALLIERQRPGVICSILLVREGRLYHSAGPTLPETYMRAIDGMAIGPTAGSCGTACHRRETVITSDVASDPLWEEYRELCLSHGLRACWSVPILSSTGEVLGTFAIYCREPRPPETTDLELLEMARRLVAIAIEQRRFADQLARQAYHDALTGLPNRVLYEDRLQQAMARARRDGRIVALFLIDLDRFKRINDMLGHRVGDMLLIQVAQRLRTRVRESDTLARWGGDEFTMVLTDLRTSDDAARTAGELLEVLRASFTIEGHELFVTASIGISLYPTDSEDPEQLLRHADSALYRAEEKGKDTYEFFAPRAGMAASERLRIETRLRQALEHNELELYYQPQVELKSGRLVGVEALLRWNHPEQDVLSPATFISIAEDSGLITPIGAWVLEEACRQTRAWQLSGYSPSLRVAVNVSPVQFGRAEFVDQVVRALERTGLPAECLELELTEGMVMRDVEVSTRQIYRLRALGVTVAIDDFGTGYSSLSYLRRLSIDTLKIAQPFVQGIEETENTQSLVRAIVALAHSLGLRVTAEGIEAPQQRRFLRRLGCDRGQGYLLGRPQPAGEFEALLKRSRF